MEYQSEENQDTVNSEQNVVSDSLISNDFNILNIMPLADDSWTWPTYNFWTQYGDLGNPANPVTRIGPGFTSWSITNIGMPGEEKVFRDTLMRALQNSFGATNGRINATKSSISSLWTANQDRYNDISNIWTVNANQNTSISGLRTDLTALTSQTSLWNTQRYNEISGIWSVNATQDATIASNFAQATTWNTQRYKDIENIWGVNKTQDTTIASNFAQATKWNTERYKDIENIWGVNGIQDTTIANLRKDATKWNTDRASQIETIWGVDSAQDTMITSNFEQATLWNTQRYNDIKTIWAVNAGQDTTIANLRKDADQWNKDRASEIETIWGVNATQDTTIANLRKDADQWNKDRASEIETIWGVDSAQNQRLDAIQAKNVTQDRHIGEVQAKNINQDNTLKAIDNRLAEIESFDFGSIIDLTVLVTAINAVGSKVQKLVDTFNVTTITPGTFTFFLQSNIKTQTDAITQALAMVDESINDNFVNYFSDSKNGQFWTAYKEFSDFQMAVFFGVFFESLQEDWEDNWLTVLDVWNTTNSFLATIAGWLDQIQVGVADSKEILAIITNWLKLIYEKPVPSFNVPSFDYVRLENMLKKLEFGEVVNEAGTNIWDFLTSLVDNLGDVITTQLEEFTKVLSEILDFLDGLIDKMVGLIVPQNLDFMRQGFDDVNLKFKAKFGDFLNISASITQMFQPIEKDFISELSFDFMGVPFVPDITILASFVPKFRNVVALLMWFNVGWWAFRRFTGTGDIVNDN